MRFILATNNQGKLLEMRTILTGLNVEVYTQKELGLSIEVEETGETFEENSFLKAFAVMQKTGLPAIADDSGLCVESLNGAPGVYSARYGGDSAPGDSQKNALILEALKSQKNRNAKFVSVITCCFPTGVALAVRGECSGIIAYAPQGSGGFGYDPIFMIPAEKRTFAQLSFEEKNKISHRGAALRSFRDGLTEFLKTY